MAFRAAQGGAGAALPVQGVPMDVTPPSPQLSGERPNARDCSAPMMENTWWSGNNPLVLCHTPHIRRERRATAKPSRVRE